MSQAKQIAAGYQEKSKESKSRLMQLIDARQKKYDRINAMKEQYQEDEFSDYNAARNKRESMDANAKRDWHDDAMQGASMGMQAAGPWGALIGLGVGTIKGQAEAISTKMNEDDMDFGSAFAGTHFDVVPGFNVGAAMAGQDGEEQSYMHKNMLEHGDDAQFWGSMSTLGSGFAKANATNEAQNAALTQKPGFAQGADLQRASSTSLSGRDMAAMPTPKTTSIQGMPVGDFGSGNTTGSALQQSAMGKTAWGEDADLWNSKYKLG